jgi:hypothetical protein
MRTHLEDEFTLALSPLRSFLRVMERSDDYAEVAEVMDQLIRSAEDRMSRLAALIETRFGPMEVLRRGGGGTGRGNGEPVEVLSGWDRETGEDASGRA